MSARARENPNTTTARPNTLAASRIIVRRFARPQQANAIKLLIEMAEAKRLHCITPPPFFLPHLKEKEKAFL
jgi:hypothetical protein